jgi:hypothetical protein
VNPRGDLAKMEAEIGKRRDRRRGGPESSEFNPCSEKEFGRAGIGFLEAGK